MDNEYPEKDYIRKEFVFNKAEQVKIISMENIAELGELAKLHINNIMNVVVLPRVGIKPNPSMGLRYDSAQGIFHIYLPKYPCEVCKTRKSEFTKEGKKYCGTCLPKSEK